MAEFTQDKNGEITHVNGIPLPPMQTVEEARAQAQKEIAAANKACEAAQAVNNQPATRNASPATSPQEVFYTGKPLIEETGQYAFLFRSYDPELSRWTTADPSGFPDGANGHAYAPRHGIEIDFLGLEAKGVINNLSDALEHWSSNAGGSVPASDSVDAEIKAYGSYDVRKTQLVSLWETLLPNVSKSFDMGIIQRSGITWGLGGPVVAKTVGSVDLTFPSYSIAWTAGAWIGNKRPIFGVGTLEFSYADKFAFEFDPNNLATIFTDVVPEWFAGDGTPFFITGGFTDTFFAQAWQYE